LLKTKIEGEFIHVRIDPFVHSSMKNKRFKANKVAMNVETNSIIVSFFQTKFLYLICWFLSALAA